MRRLVLGCGGGGRAVVSALHERDVDLVVVDDDENRVEALRGENVVAELADPTDPQVVAAHGVDVGTVVIAADDPAAGLEMAAAARAALPEARLVALDTDAHDPGSRAALGDAVDRVVGYGPTVAASLLGRIGGSPGQRLRGLARTLRGIDGSLGVFMHDNPDPDAIGSALALCDLATSMGVEASACYFGDISHQENRALVNLLDLDLRHLESDEFDPGAFAGIALVDHSRPGVNDQLPEDTRVDVVIDHHPPRGPVEARFVDLRSDAGATSTLLADYLQRFDRDVSPTVATALLYGIRVDTRDFGREITQADFDAAAFLLPMADVDVLERVENPSISGPTFDVIARAIRNQRRKGSIVVSGVGEIRDRDTLAQAADQLLAMEDVTATLVFGFAEGTAYLSARTRGTRLDIGETVRQAFGKIGSAGGHTDMAGAQLPLGILGDASGGEAESIEAVIEDLVTNRFFEVVGLRQGLDPAATALEDRDVTAE